ncbi:MAG: hypothetical protein J2P48_03045 [Alphaproteobacteria bacterium]|nr:hypothetical protein [Alphaproteobacteria bacterium]
MKHARCAAAEGGFPFDHAMAAANTLVLRCEDDTVAAALLWHRFLDEAQFLALVTGTTAAATTAAARARVRSSTPLARSGAGVRQQPGKSLLHSAPLILALVEAIT